jgi:hypothetical protein
MLIGDMLNVVGALKLKQFEWGAALVEVFNDRLKEHVVDDTKLLTIEHTGLEARAALFSLPAMELAELVGADFDPGSHAVNESPATPVAGHDAVPAPCVPCTPAPVPVTPAAPVPAPKPAPAKPVKITDPASLINSLPQKAKNNLALVMGGTLVVVALLLAVAMSATTVKKGEMPNSKALETVVQILGDVVRTYMKTSQPATPGP